MHVCGCGEVTDACVHGCILRCERECLSVCVCERVRPVG